MPLHRLTRLVLGVPDVAAAEAYYTEFGLTPLGDGRFATVDGGEQLRLVRTERRRAVQVGIGVDDPDDLDRIAANLAALGVAARREPAALTAFEEGTGVEVRVEIAERIRQAETPPAAVNGPGRVDRPNARAAALTRDEEHLRPRKLGHVVLGSTDQQRSQDFFVKGIGFKISDLIKDRAGFLRCSTDHHNLLVQSAPIRFLHHTSWQVPDVDAVGQAALRMLEADERRHVWGLGRHYVGSNFFWYLKDPAGNFTEYYSDMDVIVDEELWEPGEWEGPKTYYSWGPPPPAQMFRPEDLAAAMMGAHSS